MFQTKVVEKIKIYNLFSIIFFRKSCFLWDNEKYCRAGQATDDNMAHKHWSWIPKATNTYSGYVMLIALPQQQWSHERTLILRNKHIACPVKYMYYLNIFLEEVDPLAEVQTRTPDKRSRNCNHNNAIFVWGGRTREKIWSRYCGVLRPFAWIVTDVSEVLQFS